MGIFGMSEKELKEFAKKLSAQEIELKNREESTKLERELLEIAKSSLAKERADHLEEVKRISDQITEANAKLENRRQEVIRLEAKAKAGFAKEQEKTFKEIIEKRILKQDARQKELDKLAQRIAANFAKVNDKEGEIARRELAVTEREQSADAGFADKVTALAAEAKRQYEKNQQKANQLKEREDLLAEADAQLEAAKEALRLREKKVAEAERKRDAGYSDARAILDAELHYKRVEWQNEEIQKRRALQEKLTEQKTKSLVALEAEISTIRKNRLAEITTAEKKECDRIRKTVEEEAKRIRDEIRQERKAWEAERVKRQAELKTQSESNEKKAGELSAKEDYLAGKERELQIKERNLETQLNEQKETIEERVAERKASFDVAQDELHEEIQRLRNSLQTQTGLVGLFEQLKRQLGNNDPAEILRDLNAKTDELKRLREELATRPSAEMRERYDTLEKVAKREKERANELDAQLAKKEADFAQAANHRRKNSELEAENRSLAQKAKLWEAEANKVHAELQRLLTAYEKPAELEARYGEIKLPRITADTFTPPKKTGNIDELTWLEGIGNACDNYGLHFPTRILKAFHTALKTAEWSPLTVLAGVSGTGKSELPRLYSHFGGLLFEPLSVQPNWDSQESMLGFFNSIDNKFDAQPVLRFLAQSQQKRTNDYPGLNDAVCLILLDEMNLAHPELYFAEFLSKLELRRGMKRGEVPTLPVKVGAGMKPYELPLGRNVLWTGTMNQDETTKSLSDKVIDRSIIIHFPRPTALKRRLELNVLDENNRSPLLHKEDFFKWLAKESKFTDEQVKPYKEFIEEMNRELGVAGRAIGHRVWQSIEYYMANYPDVCAALTKGGDAPTLQKAMHTAFEDQLVQKVMPKLRGIDTRGKTRTDCLDKILGQLHKGINKMPFHLDDDFNLACELGYGQFIWQSANYLGTEDFTTKSEAKK